MTGKIKKEKITKDMKLGEIVRNYPETIPVFMKVGLHCIGCGAAHFETLEQGAAAHGIPLEPLLKELNKVVKKE